MGPINRLNLYVSSKYHIKTMFFQNSSNLLALWPQNSHYSHHLILSKSENTGIPSSDGTGSKRQHLHLCELTPVQECVRVRVRVRVCAWRPCSWISQCQVGLGVSAQSS